MLNQVEYPFEESDGTVNVENPELRRSTRPSPATSRRACRTTNAQWSDDWTAAFQNDGFATMPCPGWMLGVIEGNAEGVEGWDIADAFPGGGGNWGGSYLVVPTQSDAPGGGQGVRGLDHRAGAAAEGVRGERHVPEPGRRARRRRSLLGTTNAFFNDAPTGEILSNRALAITVQPFKGPKYSDILQAFQNALLRVDDGSATPEESWETFLSDVESLS